MKVDFSVLNFVLAGNRHSGYGLLQCALGSHPDVVCHGELFHDEDSVRRAEHESYFGSSGRVPDWFVPTHLSVEQYLNNKVFDRAKNEESAVGVKMSYDIFARHDLWEYTDQKCRKGDFCLIHVARNPVACFVSWKQSTGKTSSRVGVYVEPEEIVQFVRNHVSNSSKLDRMCTDRAIVPYHELVTNFAGVLEVLCRYLEIRFSSACVPNGVRMNRRPMKQRIVNWEALRYAVPRDVCEFLDDPYLC